MRKLILSITSIALFGLLAILGCNSRGGGGTGPGDDQLFKIHGIFVRDVNSTGTKDKTSFQLKRSDTLFNLATLTIDTFTIDTVADTTYYYRQSRPDFLRPGQSHSINLVYAPNSLNFTDSLLMPDSFSFIVTNPPNHQNTGAQLVNIEWTGSANAGGYLVFCSHDSALIDTSFFVTTGTTAAEIPADAFRIGGNPVSGLYNIFIVAYRGGLFPYTGMPFNLPSNYTPTDTTYSSIVSGRVGAAFICKLDTVRVPPP